MPNRRGRPKYQPSPLKPLERLSPDAGEALRIFASAEGPDVEARRWALLVKMASDRLRLADYFLKRSRAARKGRREGLSRPVERDSISRGYYAMYHAARAIHLLRNGFDIDDHQRLPQEIRKFGGPKWERTYRCLARWRQARNEADYSPYYPVSLAKDGGQALKAAETVVRFCRSEFDRIRGGSAGRG